MPNLFLSGGFKNGIACWDLASNKVVMQCSDLFGQVQSLEFINGGQEFISSSDILKRNSLDRGIIVWDFQKGVPLSNQVYMEAYSCTAVRAHVNQKHFIAQSNGNYIAIFSTKKPYKLNTKKVSTALCEVKGERKRERN
jgi:WD40 repeat protein